MRLNPHYRELKSCAALERYVECFWIRTAPAAIEAPYQSHRVLPDGCIDLIFEFGNLGHMRGYFVGTMTEAFVVQSSVVGADTLGIRFRPGGIKPFLDIPAFEYTDESLNLFSIWKTEGRTLWERLAETKTPENRILLLETELLRRLKWAPQFDPYIETSVEMIRGARGKLSVSDLERRTGLSIRQLERKFKNSIGISPKSFARVVRFQDLVQSISTVSVVNWAELALRHGYSDQSHFNREFKDFSGITPSGFVAPH